MKKPSPYMKFYFTAEEQDFIRAQGKGYVRRLVQAAMAPLTSDAIVANEVIPGQTAIPACRFCGSHTLAGRCTSCGRLQ